MTSQSNMYLLMSHEWDSRENSWKNLARNVANTTDFHLMGGESVEDVFTSCAIGIPTSLQVQENYTFLAHIDLTNTYQSTYSWGNITLRKDKETIHFSQRYLPSRKVCHIYRLPKKTVKTHSYPIRPVTLRTKNLMERHILSYLWGGFCYVVVKPSPISQLK